MTDVDLKGRRALVTGGASGIGAACAGKFAAAGATVVVADLDGGAAAGVAESAGGVAVAVDLADPSFDAAAMVEKQIADQARIHGIPESEVVEKIVLTEPAVKRLIEPSEVGDLAVWLCGPGMSFANGSSFVLDGRWTAR